MPAAPLRYRLSNVVTRLTRKPSTVGFLSLLAVMSAAPRAAADEVRAVITAVVDETGQNYGWTVTNRYYSPIVSIEFAHYKGHLLFAPEGWSVDCTNLFRIGWQDETGVCRATCDSPAAGIVGQRSEVFKMHVGDRGVAPGPGNFLVRFVSGESYTVTGVPLPARYEVEGKYASLLGLGSIFLLWLIYRWLSRRRAGGAGPRHDARAAPQAGGGD